VSHEETDLGFDRGSPLSKGLSIGKSSMSGMLSFVAIPLVVMVPWSLVDLGICWVVRRISARKCGPSCHGLGICDRKALASHIELGAFCHDKKYLDSRL
jgi:hypothetical protein